MYTLHPATMADYEYCYRLCKTAMLTLFTKHWGGWKPEVFRSNFDPLDTTVIKVKGRRAGWYSIRDLESHLFLSDIYISPRYRGKGIGTSVIAKILRSSPHRTVRLTTFVDNPAINLYRRTGFHVDTVNDGVVNMLYTVTDSAGQQCVAPKRRSPISSLVAFNVILRV